MKKYRSVKKIPAYFWTASLLACLALSACSDATPTNAVKTTPPLQTSVPLTPFSPLAFVQDTTTAATTSAVTTATTPAVTTAVLTTGLATTAPTTSKATIAIPTTSLTTTSAPSTNPAGSIKNNWLHGIPCKAPCWENITPGKTTPEEAQALLKQNSAIGNIQVGALRSGNNPPTIYGFLQSDNFKDLGLISYHNDPKPAKIEVIKVEVDFYQPEDVFALYGEPSHVIVIEKTNELGLGTGDYKTYLVYLNQGLILSSIYTREASLTPASVFNEVYFFIPGQEGFNIIDTLKEFNTKLLVSWEGFKDLKYYCRYQVVTGIKTC